ncbi:MAG: hypothetical protein AABW65_01465 [Nanoarchaeota archaeon]
MTSEHIKLSKAEIIYSQKNLLESTIDLLKITKKYKEYQNLRKNELAMKILLKNKIESLQDSLALLDKLLPKTSHDIENISAEKKYLAREKMDLEDEIESIRKKLSMLR